jgi:hypothetical protein
MKLISTAVVAAVLALAGCDRLEQSVAEHSESHSVDLDKTEMVRVEVKMGAGELHMRSGAVKLMEGEFHYLGNNRPEIRYDSSPFRGKLVIRTVASKEGASIAAHDRWDVSLNETVPMDVDVNLGAGQGKLDLGRLALRDVNVNLGAGQVDLDLRGPRTLNMNVRVNGGVGEAVLRLPKDAGIRLEAKGGIGSIQVRGLDKRGSYYKNELYDTAKVVMDVKVHGGIGAINVYAE